MLRIFRRRRAHLTTASVLALLCAAPAAIAAPAEPTITFTIPAGTMESVLTTYAIQAHVQLLYTPDLVAGRRSPGLSGALTAREALGRLLSGSGLMAQESRPGVIVLKMGVVAQDDPPADAPAPVTSALTELVVTGTHIRGADAGAAPILQFDRGEIDRQGYATVADTLAALPQNFSGVATPDVISTGLDTGSLNYARATSVNLRGLGPDATLVLINGRRMAGTGGKGDFADVSALPTAAVQQVDVLLDGASALYGSDAVGGVVNVILRRDFDGAETRARYGGARGGAEEVQLAQTVGRVWSTGHVLASYEYYERDALPFAARSFTATSDLRPFGGRDWRSISASPGNVLITDPPTNAAVPTYAIPTGATSFPLKPADFLKGLVILTNPREGTDLEPHQTRHSVYLAATQALGERLEINADLRFSRRRFDNASTTPTATITIASNNPWFASPNGAKTQNIAYSFLNDLGPSHAFGLSDSLGVSIGADARLWGDWRLDAYAAFAEERIHSGTNGNLNVAFLREAVGATADNPATPFNTAVDGFFNPYGTGQANSRRILDFIGSGYGRQRFNNQVASFNLEADGKLWTLPGGDVRLAVGAAGRHETFAQTTESFAGAATPTITHPPAYERTVTAAFAELRAPLVGEANARPGLKRLELSLATRVEHYDDVGTTVDPKIGLIWAPVDGLKLRTTYGTSFRAPALSEVFQAPVISATTFTQSGSQLLALTLTGGNRDLRPETATSWTAGVDIAPPSLPGLKIAATLFDTEFTDQVDRPVTRYLSSGITNPLISSFVRLVNPAVAGDLAAVQALLNDPAYTTPGRFPANTFNAIVDARYVNTATLHVRGLDLSGGYGFSRGADQFDLAVNASYLFRYDQQLTPTSPSVDQAGIAGQPARLRTRSAATWSRGPFGATLAWNHLGRSKAETGKRIDAWDTADLQLRWSPDKAPFQGLSLALSVQNLFDADPPFYDSSTGVGYDAANAEPLGRYTSIQLTKRW